VKKKRMIVEREVERWKRMIVGREVERWKRMIDGHEIRGKKIAMIDDL